MDRAGDAPYEGASTLDFQSKEPVGLRREHIFLVHDVDIAVAV